MKEATFPASLSELCDSNSLKLYGIRTVKTWDSSDLSDEDVSYKLQEFASFDVETFSEEIDVELGDTIISTVYSFAKNFESLSNENQISYCEAIVDKAISISDFVEERGESNVLEGESRNFVKLLLFLFCGVTSQIEDVYSAIAEVSEKPKKGAKGKKSKKASDDDGPVGDETFVTVWPMMRKAFLQAFSRIITLKPALLWTMSTVQENFLTMIWMYVIKIFEAKPLGVKTGLGSFDKEVKSLCIDIISHCVSLFGSADVSGCYGTFISGVMEAIMRTEHMGNLISEVCTKCSPVLTAEFVNEMSNVSSSGTASTMSMKHIGMFIEDLAKMNSNIMITHLPLVMRQLNSDAHQVRSSLLAALGHLVCLLDKSLKSGEYVEEKENTEEMKNENEGEGEESEGATDTEVRGNTTMSPRLRDTILDIIVERTHDVSPYTRSAVLRVWHTLLVANAVPVRRLASVAEIAYDRLSDKAVAVRKGAMSLLIQVMEQNPYGSSLDHCIFQKQKMLYEAKLNERLEELKAISIAQTKALLAMPDSDEEEAVSEVTATATDMEMEEETKKENETAEKIRKEEKESETTESEAEIPFDMEDFMDSQEVKDDQEINTIRTGLEYCTSALEVIAALIAACNKVPSILKSKSVPEVVEALKFVTQTVNFNIRGSLKMFMKATNLVFHNDKNIREECLTCFQNIFLLNGDASLSAQEVSQNLVRVVSACEGNDAIPIEEIISNLAIAGLIDEEVSALLWGVVSDFDNDSSNNFNQVSCAIRLLTLLYREEAGKGKSFSWGHIETIVSNGLSNKAISNMEFPILKATGQFLQLVKPTEFDLVDTSTLKGKAYEDCIERLVTVIMGEFCADNEYLTKKWFSSAEEAIKALFKLHSCADRIMAKCISSLYIAMSSPNDNNASRITCSTAKMARFFFIIGQSAIQLLVMAESYNLQSRKAAKIAAGSSDDAMGDAETNAAIDLEHDTLMSNALDQGLLLDNLFSKFHPLIAAVLAQTTDASSHLCNPTLTQCATLSLCQLMCVSNGICDKYLALLFTSLSNVKDEACRTTIMVAIGDLMSRFPNSLEAWTSYIYARLCDDKTVVRYNALMVLTHMILNDMIKVKGQVVNVVLCLTDPVDKICDLAKTLFIKLNERSNNPLFNLMSDIIGNISSKFSDKEKCGDKLLEGDDLEVAALELKEVEGRRTLSFQEFITTVDFLISFIKNAKQSDLLIERLLPRIISSVVSSSLFFFSSFLLPPQRTLITTSSIFFTFYSFQILGGVSAQSPLLLLRQGDS